MSKKETIKNETIKNELAETRKLIQEVLRTIAVANWERPASGTMATLHSLAKTIRFHLARAQDEVELVGCKVQDVLYSITH